MGLLSSIVEPKRLNSILGIIIVLLSAYMGLRKDYRPILFVALIVIGCIQVYLSFILQSRAEREDAERKAITMAVPERPFLSQEEKQDISDYILNSELCTDLHKQCLGVLCHTRIAEYRELTDVLGVRTGAIAFWRTLVHLADRGLIARVGPFSRPRHSEIKKVFQHPEEGRFYVKMEACVAHYLITSRDLRDVLEKAIRKLP